MEVGRDNNSDVLFASVQLLVANVQESCMDEARIYYSWCNARLAPEEGHLCTRPVSSLYFSGKGVRRALSPVVLEHLDLTA